MNRSGLVRCLKQLATDHRIRLRKSEIATSVGHFILAHSRISCQGQDINGFGIADLEEAAIDKALSETLERYYFLFSEFLPQEFKPASLAHRFIGAFAGKQSLESLENLGRHSVGCAVGVSRRQAIWRAICELIERHTILAAQIMSLPGQRAAHEEFFWDKREIHMTFYCWQGPLETFCVLAEIIHVLDGRVLFSSGAGKTVAEALSKSRLEGMAMLTNFKNATNDIPNLASTSRIQDLKCWHMLNFSRQPFYQSSHGPALPPKIDVSLTWSDFWAATKKIDTGLHFARAYSPQTQNLFVGHWRPERIHPRLQHFWSEGMEPPYAY